MRILILVAYFFCSIVISAENTQDDEVIIIKTLLKLGGVKNNIEQLVESAPDSFATNWVKETPYSLGKLQVDEYRENVRLAYEKHWSWEKVEAKLIRAYRGTLTYDQLVTYLKVIRGDQLGKKGQKKWAAMQKDIVYLQENIDFHLGSLTKGVLNELHHAD